MINCKKCKHTYSEHVFIDETWLMSITDRQSGEYLKHSMCSGCQGDCIFNFDE